MHNYRYLLAKRRVGGKGAILRSSTLIKPNGEQESGFPLQHDITYVWRKTYYNNKDNDQWWFREACAINDPDTQSVIITGGSPTVDYFNSSLVHVYGLDGWQKDLPPMNRGRQNHACTSFTLAEKRVRKWEKLGNIQVPVPKSLTISPKRKR